MERVQFMRSAIAGIVAAAAIVSSLPPLAEAQEQSASYPSRQIEFVVPFPAGGSADVIARLVARAVGETWRQTIVIQNRAGATGQIAGEYVTRASPHGYVLLLATASTHTVLPAFKPNLPYDTVTGFTPATLVSTFPNMLVVNPQKVPAQTVAAFIRYVKDNPGKLNYASTGQGSSTHFTAELFKLMTGTQMTHVPYRGGSTGHADLISGNVDLTFDNMASVLSLAQEGKLKALGVASLERTPLAPQIPAIAETVPGFEANSWVGVVAPPGTPAGIVERIAQAFGDGVQRADVAKRLNELGATASPNTPAEFVKFLRDDRERWQRVAREAGLSAGN